MHLVDSMAFFRDLSPERAEELRRVLEADPAAAALFRRWRAVWDSMATGVRESIVDTETFGLFVLAGHAGNEGSHEGHLLTDDERARVEEAAPTIRRALDAGPGLRVVAEDMRKDRQAFEAAWDEWFGEGRRVGVDRPPARRREDHRRSVPAAVRSVRMPPPPESIFDGTVGRPGGHRSGCHRVRGLAIVSWEARVWCGHGRDCSWRNPDGRAV